MNYGNRFSIALLTLALCACAKQELRMMKVSPDEYASEGCWEDKQGKLSSFLVLADNDSSFTPYLVSAKCFVDDNYSSYGEAALHNLNAVRLIDTSSRLQRMFAGSVISSNFLSDQPMPSSESKVYYLQARANRLADSSKPAYQIVNVEKLSDTRLSFEQYLSSPQTERENMLRRLIKTP